jgi:uncharacterized membrane protein YebE (DUF533 family)
MVNHLPVALALVGAVSCMLALFMKREGVWSYAAVTVLLAGLAAPVALLSGRQAEHPAEELWYVSGAAVHEHEEAAEKATWVAAAAGALALVAMRWKAPKWRISMAVLALVAIGAMGYAAFEGGEIVHENPQLEETPTSGITP